MKDEQVWFSDILESIEKIFRYTSVGKEHFFQDTQVQDAVVRNLEIIGEAASQVPEQIRLQYPDIPWRGMSTLRNMLIHQYHRVDYDRVWVVIEKDLPALKREIEKILPDAR